MPCTSRGCENQKGLEGLVGRVDERRQFAGGGRSGGLRANRLRVSVLRDVDCEQAVTDRLGESTGDDVVDSPNRRAGFALGLQDGVEVVEVPCRELAERHVVERLRSI